MFKMQTRDCLSFTISTQDLILSVSYCLQDAELTDRNFGTREKVAIAIPLMPWAFRFSVFGASIN